MRKEVLRETPCCGTPDETEALHAHLRGALYAFNYLVPDRTQSGYSFKIGPYLLQFDIRAESDYDIVNGEYVKKETVA